jgi:hypothetical protein
LQERIRDLARYQRWYEKADALAAERHRVLKRDAVAAVTEDVAGAQGDGVGPAFRKLGVIGDGAMVSNDGMGCR